MNFHSIIWTKFGRRNCAARASERCFIRHRFHQHSNTRRGFWRDTTTISFVLPRFLVRNTDFLAKRRTTWRNGKATKIPVFASPFTACTLNIASRLRRCWRTSMFCSSISRTSVRATTPSFGRCIFACAPANKGASQSLCSIDRTRSTV